MVTVEQLKDFPYLRKEIAILNDQLQDLRGQKASPTRSRSPECVAALIELIRLLQDQRKRSVLQLKQLQAFFDGIDDPGTRDIFRMRFELSLTWPQICRAMEKRGYFYEESGPRKIVARYLSHENEV